MSVVELRDVRKAFGPVEVVKGVDLEIASGEFVVFVGPSGCGKSTLLRIVSGLEEITAGRITIDGRDVTDLPPGDRQVAMVFQSYALYPHMTAHENMAFALRMGGMPRGEVERRVAEAARILQIETLLERKPKQLSGGQRQRVAIGRAIVRKPKVFLFDEPLSNLDAALRAQMRVEIARLHAEIGATMIYVTHDQVEAMTLADRIVVLNHGRVEQIGSPLELYETPANRFVAGFLGQPKMNFVEVGRALDGSHAVSTPGGREIDLPQAQFDGSVDTLVLGFRPDSASIVEPAHGHLVGRVAVIEHLGSESLVYVAIDGAKDLLVVVAPGKSPLARGDEVGVRLSASGCHLFEASGKTIPKGSPEWRSVT